MRLLQLLLAVMPEVTIPAVMSVVMINVMRCVMRGCCFLRWKLQRPEIARGTTEKATERREMEKVKIRKEKGRRETVRERKVERRDWCWVRGEVWGGMEKVCWGNRNTAPGTLQQINISIKYLPPNLHLISIMIVKENILNT